MAVFPVLYFIVCVLVGLFAIGKRGGFLLYFAISLFLTPLLALLVLILTTRKSGPTAA